MKIILIGNGLDIMLGSNISLGNTKNDILNVDKKKSKLEYPENLKAFWKKPIKGFNSTKGECRITDQEYEIIRKNIEESKETNIEKWIFNVSYDKQISLDAYEDFKTLFIKYVHANAKPIEDKLHNDHFLNAKVMADKISPLVKKNYLLDKLNSYDFILTTNYDSIIEEIIGVESSSKVIHIHGSIKENDSFLDNKSDVLQRATETVFGAIDAKKEYIKNSLKRIKNSVPHIKLDIFGWGFGNEEDIIQIILRRFTAYMYGDFSEEDRVVYDNKFYKDELMNEKQLKGFLNDLYEINYYYHDTEALRSMFRSNYVDKLSNGAGFDDHKFLTIGLKNIDDVVVTTVLKECRVNKPISITTKKMYNGHIRWMHPQYNPAYEKRWMLFFNNDIVDVVMNENISYERKKRELSARVKKKKITSEEYMNELNKYRRNLKGGKIINDKSIIESPDQWENEVEVWFAKPRINLIIDSKFIQKNNGDYVLWDKDMERWLIW